MVQANRYCCIADNKLNSERKQQYDRMDSSRRTGDAGRACCSGNQTAATARPRNPTDGYTINTTRLADGNNHHHPRLKTLRGDNS